MAEFRTVLRSEVVFDMGDTIKSIPVSDIEGRARAWQSLVRQVHATWDVLNECQVRYWGALSAGVGVHTHVFLAPLDEPAGSIHRTEDPDGVIQPSGTSVVGEYPAVRYRRAFATAIMHMAQARLIAGDSFAPDFDCDPRLLDPPWHSQLVREFGAVKRPEGRAKVLWAIGPGRYNPLPSTRKEAYEQASDNFKSLGSIGVPTELPLNEAGPGLLGEAIRAFLGKRCAQTEECWRNPPCETCPATM